MTTKLRTALRLFRKDDRGATAIEYGLIAAGIAVAIAAAVFALGGDLAGVFGDVSDAVTTTPGNTNTGGE